MKDKQYSPRLFVVAPTTGPWDPYRRHQVWKIWYYRSEQAFGIHRTDGPAEIDFNGETWWEVNNEK
jgi:hypothetical protein